MSLNKDIIDRFQNALKEAKKNTSWQAAQNARNQKRELVQKEILNLLNSYLDGKVTTSELRETFDKKTRKEWDLFGLKGTSGAMFLNMLVLHIPNQEALAVRLKAALKMPADEASAKKQMADFVLFLLRMSDLMSTCPNSIFPCFIVLPENRAPEVVKQLSRPTFQALEINQRCGFFTFESLKQEMPAIMKWAKSPSSIRDLAKFVDDVS